MNYQDYLNSDHWKSLRGRKHRSVRRSLGGKLRCAICASTESIQTHHLFYRNLYDVELSDLRLLCDTCHQVAHELITSGELSKARYKSHHAMFAATKGKVKHRRGLTGRNLFKPK